MASDYAHALLGVVLGNPYRVEVRQARRLLEQDKPWSSDLKWWIEWFREFQEVVPVEIAGTALAMGVGLSALLDSKPNLEEAARALPESSRPTCMELAERALAVTGLLHQIVGDAAAMNDVRANAWNIAFGRDLITVGDLAKMIHSAPVLILGETGTGKELVARALGHCMPGVWKSGHWTPATFEAVHLASFPETLVEDALFGHEKGAFTGAKDSQPGVLERCHNGVVFLDEVADLPLKTQVSLLRVLQEGKVRRLGGGAKEWPAKPRVISATHKPLRALIAKGEFREDLFHRLSACVLHLPPLRERREDIPLLAERELGSVSSAFQPILKAEIDAFLAQHDRYEWPGNVRELTKVVHSLALGITPQLSTTVVEAARPGLPEELTAGRWTMEEVRRWYAQRVASLGGSRDEVARRLGIDRGTLRKLLGG